AEHPQLAGSRVEPSVRARLAGEPEDPVAVERRGVEAHRGERLRERKALDLVRLRVDAHDRVLAAVGDPRRAIRSDDDTVRRRARTELDRPRLSVLGWSQPSSPESCAVYQTPPSAAGATSCGPWPRVTENSCSTNSAEDGVAPGLGDVPATSGAAAVADDVAIGVYT